MMLLRKFKLHPKVWTAVALMLSFVIIIGVYFVAVKFDFGYIVYIYAAVACGLIVAYFVINRGFESSPPDISQLPEEWDEARKSEYISECNIRHARAKKLLFVLLPVLVVLMIETILILLGK